MASGTSTNTPKRAIRRFDVFAEYNRIEGLDKGLDEAHAKGYGLWVAKVVASGGSRRTSTSRQHGGAEEHGERREEPSTQDNHDQHGKQEWHELSGEPQTDDLFDHEIIERMGKGFYAHVFSPAIRQAVEQDRSYENIRDTIRKDWKPPK